MSKTSYNILYIAHLSSKYTGANKSLLALLSGLKKRGVNSVVLMPQSHDMTLMDELEKIGVEGRVLRYFMPVYTKSRTLKEKLQFFPKLIRAKWLNYAAEVEINSIVKELGINLIHTNVGPMFLGFDVSRKLNLPHVWHLREFQDIDFNMKTWCSKEKFKSRLSMPNNYPIAISEAVSKHFDLGPPAQVIYNGVMKASEVQFIPKKENYFLFVGFLIETKGVGILLKAFAAFVIKHPNYKLLLAGYAPDKLYLRKLQDFISRTGISSKVEFLGKRDDVPALMSKATALLVPSFNEAFGRITAEAMFNGCLVIGKNTGGTKEIIEKIGVGILYNTDEDLINAMEVVSTRGLQFYQKDLHVAMDRAAEIFSEEGNAEQIFNFYETICHR